MFPENFLFCIQYYMITCMPPFYFLVFPSSCPTCLLPSFITLPSFPFRHSPSLFPLPPFPSPSSLLLNNRVILISAAHVSGMSQVSLTCLGWPWTSDSSGSASCEATTKPRPSFFVCVCMPPLMLQLREEIQRGNSELTILNWWSKIKGFKMID